MHTGYYFGIFLAAIVNYTVGIAIRLARGVRGGGAPALLVAFIRYGVVEPKRWQERLTQLNRRWTARDAFTALFSPEYRRRTVVNSVAALYLDGRPLGGLCLCALVGARSWRRANGAQMAS